MFFLDGAPRGGEARPECTLLLAFFCAASRGLPVCRCRRSDACAYGVCVTPRAAKVVPACALRDSPETPRV